MSDPSVTPALAAHREALAEALAAQEWPDLTWAHIKKYATPDRFYRRADAVLAYFADPAHGLTVETGAVECEDCESAGRNCLIHRRHPDDASPAHGLVRDEPSEDERVSDEHLALEHYRRGWSELRGVLSAYADRLDEHVWSEFDAVLADEWCDAPARSDDGRTAVELTDDETNRIGWQVHRFNDDYRMGRMNSDQQREQWADLFRDLLAARLRHDDGEADR